MYFLCMCIAYYSGIEIGVNVHAYYIYTPWGTFVYATDL